MICNHLKIFLFIFSAISLLAVSSCSKIDDFGSLNSDPNAAQDPYPAGLLTNTLVNFGATYAFDAGGISTTGALYSQLYSETQYTEVSRYQKTNSSWDGYYAGAIKDLQVIIDYNTNSETATSAAAYGPNENQIAIARILKAYIFWFLTDSYGDIPYKGVFTNNGIIPYTSQQEVYDSLFAEMDGAVNQFQVPGLDDDVVKGDILFSPTSASTQIKKWQQFANSARALMALRLSKVNPDLGKQQFLAALAAPGGVLEEGDNVTENYPGGNFPSPIYNYYNITSRKDYAVSDVLIDFMGNTSDDRVYAYATTTTGFPYGLTRDAAIDFNNSTPGWARIGGSGIFADGINWGAETAPLVILSSAEIYLARAEAAFLGWTTESIEDLYLTGIKESYKQWDVYAGTISDAFGGGELNGEDYDAYVAQDGIALTNDANDYEKIATQEWIAHYPKGWMAWADWRRTGYPELTPASGQSAIPLRISYSQTEFSLNPSNVATSAAQYTGSDGTNSIYAPLWWDK